MDVSNDFKNLAAILQTQPSKIAEDKAKKDSVVESLCLKILQARDDFVEPNDILNLQAKLHLLNPEMAGKIFNQLVKLASKADIKIFQETSVEYWKNYAALCQLIPVSQQNEELLGKIHQQLREMAPAQIDELHAFFKSMDESARLEYFETFSSLHDVPAKEKLAILSQDLLHTKILDVTGTILADTDLVVFKDDYKGQLPINGIKESAYKNACELFDKIINNKTSLQIIGEVDTSKPVKLPIQVPVQQLPGYAKMFDAIKQLFTRELGRRLLNQLTTQNQQLLLMQSTMKTGFHYKSTIPAVNLSLNPDEGHAIEQTPIGKKIRRTPELTHVKLAHELIHFLHYLADKSSMERKPPTLGAHYDDLEEQITIMGFAKEPQTRELTDEEFEKACQDLTSTPQSYGELNERSITAAFTNDKQIFYPREGHHGMDIVDPKTFDRPNGLAMLEDFLTTLAEKGLALEVLENMEKARATLGASKFFSKEDLEATLSPVKEEIIVALQNSTHPWHEELSVYLRTASRLSKVKE